MHCPRCKHEDTAVIDSRLSEEGRAVRRRRECPKCDHRFTSYERQELSSLIVIKRDGTREPYSRSKLERGIWRSGSKRPVSEAYKAVDALIDPEVRAPLGNTAQAVAEIQGGRVKSLCPACDGNKVRHVFGYVNGEPIYVQVEDR